jgi:hypothetical protein
MKRYLVAAERVIALCRDVGIFQGAAVARLAVMVQDYFPVKVFKNDRILFFESRHLFSPAPDS